MTRIYERQTDALFASALTSNPAFASAFLSAVNEEPGNQITGLAAQTPHRAAAHSGSINLEITCANGSILLVENKIDAGYSVTSAGDPQPDRYRASVAALKSQGRNAASVLLAPEVYLKGANEIRTNGSLLRIVRFHPQIGPWYEVLQTTSSRTVIQNACDAASVTMLNAVVRCCLNQGLLSRTILPFTSGKIAATLQANWSDCTISQSI